MVSIALEKLIAQIEKTAPEVEFTGVVSLFQGASVLFNQAFGYRDRAKQLPNTTRTRFGTASGTKVFTALGIGVLIDQGKLSLDTPVGEVDKEHRGFIDEKATILQLLTHSSGIHDYYDEEIAQDFENFSVAIPWHELETPTDYFPLFKDEKLKFQAGERYSYSNGGYVFLGMIIERLTGKLYRDFIHTHVLQPAGMDDSGFFPLNNLPDNTAKGYLTDRKTTNLHNLPLRGGGDGGMYTTTHDLRAFWEALFSQRILSGELTEIFLKTHHSFDAVNGYGCGVYKRLDDSMYWISGSDAGVGFASRYLAREKITINILSNLTDGEEAIADVIFSHL